MSELAIRSQYSSIFMLSGHGDLKIEWNESDHDAVVAMIQTKMNEGITFYILDPSSKAKKPPVVEIEQPAQIPNRQVYIRDPDISKLVEGGFATIAQFSGESEMKVTGKAKTAEDAAAADTIAVRPAKGG